MATRNYKGIWTDVENYVENDVVLSNYRYYLAVNANSSDKPPSSNWVIISAVDTLCYIIQQSLGLEDGRIFVANQGYRIPKDKKLFIVIQSINKQIYSNYRRYVGETENLKEKGALLTIENLTINLLSKGDESIAARDDLLLGLGSTFSEQQQEIYNIKIAKFPNSVANVSEVEGAGMLNRFAIDIAVHSWAMRENNVDYYDQFSNSIIQN